MVIQYDYRGCLQYILKKKQKTKKSIIIIVEILVSSFRCIQLIKKLYLEQYRNVPTSSPAGQNIVTDGPFHPQKQTQQGWTSSDMVHQWHLYMYGCGGEGMRGLHVACKQRQNAQYKSQHTNLIFITHTSVETVGWNIIGSNTIKQTSKTINWLFVFFLTSEANRAADRSSGIQQ